MGQSGSRGLGLQPRALGYNSWTPSQLSQFHVEFVFMKGLPCPRATSSITCAKVSPRSEIGTARDANFQAEYKKSDATGRGITFVPFLG